ncbi:hypothetical protein [Limnobacter parvus]|uniref:Type 4 secretion system PilS N-terminal domain-containing protein n=1 Tax=Limnobacter parvus TaxID=2939690 RepID=A0ABT1XJY9_9BURK|nr:hypothetical protein [Limnobacter parvus]MCR2747610.1 hypothetical protein [Limnobacter parvus]
MKTMQQNFQARKQEMGITLIEVSIGLIIAAVVAAVAFIAFQNNARRNEVRENTIVITEIIAEAKQKFGRTNQFTALTGTNNATDPAIVSRTIPAAIATGGNSYGVRPILYGSTNVAVAETTAGNFATLAWGGIPPEQCYDLVTSLAQATTGMFISNAAPVTTGPGNTTSLVSTTGVINAVNATAACNGITATGTIYFVFDRI